MLVGAAMLLAACGGSSSTATQTNSDPDPERRGYKPDAFVASFMGAAPAEAPELAVVIMIREPDRKLGHYGGKVAGPAVRNVIDAALSYLGVPPDKSPPTAPSSSQP
jgi:cell division protein FtsI (penicillin-binding protein 3)